VLLLAVHLVLAVVPLVLALCTALLILAAEGLLAKLGLHLGRP
jgi:hypothetical protein